MFSQLEIADSFRAIDTIMSIAKGGAKKQALSDLVQNGLSK